MDGVNVRWDEEVIKWLAVGMILAMVGMAVMPAVSVGDLAKYLQNHAEKPWIREAAQYLETPAEIEVSMYTSIITAALIAGATIPVAGWLGLGAAVGAVM